MDPQPPDAPLPPPPPEPALPPAPAPRKAPFPTWKQGFVLLLGGLALFLSACFGCLSTLNSRGNTTNDALFTLLAIVALIGGTACAIGGVFVFIRMMSALFAPKPKK
jgi:hypothetical protein